MKIFTVKHPDGKELVVDAHELLSGYNNHSIDGSWAAKQAGKSEWSQVRDLIGVEPAILPKRTQPSADTPQSVPTRIPDIYQSPAELQNNSLGGATDESHTFAVLRRYKDSYLVARAIVTLGEAVKIIGIVVGIITSLGTIILGTQTQGPMSAAIIFSGILIAAIIGVLFYIVGILVTAQGQLLKATLDAAVHTSPFLRKQEMADIMSL